MAGRHLVLALMTATAAAQTPVQPLIITTPRPAPTSVSTRAYPARAAILREREVRRAAERSAEMARTATPAPAPTSYPVFQPPTYDPYAPVIFPDVKTFEKKPAAAATPAPVEAPPPPPAGLRGAGLGTLEGNDSAALLLDSARRAAAAQEVAAILKAKPVLDELALVGRIADAMGIPRPRRPETLGSLGVEVGTDGLRAGDLLVFELRGRRHVAVYAGEGRFAYSTRQGVSAASLSRLPWIGKLVGARRLP